MSDPRRTEGRQPYDTMNGVRIGALSGALISAPVAWLASLSWTVVIGAILGGIVGWFYARNAERVGR